MSHPAKKRPARRLVDPAAPTTLARDDGAVRAGAAGRDTQRQRLLDLYEEHVDELETVNQKGSGWDLIAAAALLARTPSAPLPDGA